MRRRFATVLIPVLLFTLGNCGVTGPGEGVDGLWASTAAAPGTGINLSLRTAIDIIKGTRARYITGGGAEYVQGGFFDSLTVAGHWTHGSSFHLDLKFHASSPAIYEGSLVGPNQLDGTLTRNGETATHFAFIRQTQ